MDDATDNPWNGQEMTPQPLRVQKRDFSDQDSGSPRFEVTSVSPTGAVRHESMIPRKPSFKPDLNLAYAVSGNIVEEEAVVSQSEASPQVSSPSLKVRKTRQHDIESSTSSISTVSTRLITNPSSSAQYTGTRISANDGTPTHGRINGSEFTSERVSNRRESSDDVDTSGTDTFYNCGINMGYKLEQSRSHPRRYKRAASSGVSSRRNNESGIQLPIPSSLSHQAIIRQPSFRHRMLNRMASGFPTDLDLAQSNPDSGTSGVPLRSSRIVAQEGRAEVKLRSATIDSIQSAQTQTSFASDTALDSTIASFPSPPKTGSATVICSSPESSNHATSQPPTFVRPREATVLGAKLTVVPELSRVIITDMNGMKSFFVAVQVEGIIDPSTTVLDFEDDSNNLDIIVIIDNSLYASPVALWSSCDIAGEIASTLDTDRDRLAIATTSPLGENGLGGGLMLMPLSKISPRGVRRLLDSVVGNAAIPTKGYLAEQIEHAKRHFRLLAPHLHDVEPSFVSACHIVVLTPNPGAIAQSVYGDKSIGLHVICPGSIPWRRMATETGDGWRIHSLFQPTEPLHPAQTVKFKDHYAKIHTLISHLRSGSSSGKLLNLDVVIKASPDCTTDGSMGMAGFPSLQPGEVRTIMVKVKMRTPRPELTYPSSFAGAMGDSINEKLVKEIQAILGPKPVPILRVKLRYNHSKLPRETVLEMRSEANVEVSSLQSPQIGGTLGEQEKRRNSATPLFYVQKCLVYYLATHAEVPSHGLKILRDHFSSENGACVCAEYLSSVVDELRYQERVLQRLELAYNVGDTFKELVEGGFRNNLGYKPFSWIVLPHDEYEPSGGALRQEEPRESAVNPFSDAETITPDSQLHRMRSDLTIVDAPTEDGLASPFRGIPKKLKANFVDKNEARPSTRELRQVKFRATIANKSSKSEAVTPYSGQRRVRPSGASIGTSKNELALPHRALRYKKSKPTDIETLSDDDTAPLLGGLRSTKAKVELEEAEFEEELTSPPRGVHHVRSNTMIGGDNNGSPRLQRVARHIRSKPAVNESSEASKDPARQIWGGLRNQNKATTEAGLAMYGESSTMGHGSPHSFKQNKEGALKTKKSAGQDTLLGISRRGHGEENVPPWL